MLPILQGCRLTWHSQLAAWPDLHTSLEYQARQLGISCGPQQSIATASSSAWELFSPAFGKLQNHIAVWQDANNLRPADELSMQAASGLLGVHARARGQVSALGLPYLSVLTAALSLQGGLASALGYLRGQPCAGANTSISAATLLALRQYRADALASSTPLPTAETWNGPPFCSQDGQWFELEALSAEPWQRFCEQLDLPARIADLSWRAFMLRYARACSPLPPELAQSLRRMPYLRIAALARACKVAICPLRMDGSLAPELKQAGAPWQFSVAEQAISAAGQRGDVVASGLPLAGLVVLESCRRIQGPLAGFLLAQLGARVIRLEPPGGDPLRSMPPLQDHVSARFAALNRNKEVLEVDLKTATGRAQVRDLAAQADVFLHNWAPNKAQEMALDSEHLRAVNPRLLYTYASGWGQHKIDLPGTDFILQAYSGLSQSVQQANQAPGGTLFTMLDILGGVVAAQGICAGLLHNHLQQQESAGRALARVDTSLLSSASLLAQAMPSELSSDANKSVYACRDGWLACASSAAMRSTFALPADADLAAHLQNCAVAPSVAQLQAQGIAASVVLHDLAAPLAADEFACHVAIWQFSKPVQGKPFKDLVPAALRQAWQDEGIYPQRGLFQLFAEQSMQRGGQVAVQLQDHTISYQDLQQASLCLARGLQALGVGTGSIVASQLPNQWQACTLDLALAALGAVVAPLPPGRGWLDVLALLKRSQANFFIASDAPLLKLLADAEDQLPHLRQLVLTAPDADLAQLPNLEQMLAGPAFAVEDLLPIDPNQALRLLVSSGTEAEPKLVAYSHNALAGGRGRFLQRLHAASGAEHGPMRALFLVPMGSSFGSLSSFGILACLGGSLIFLPQFDAELALQTIAQQNISHVFGVPTMLQRMAGLLAQSKQTLPSLRAVVSGGAILDPASVARCRQAFGCAVVSLYGSADGVNCHTMPDDPLERVQHSVGKPNPSICEIRIVDEHRQTLPTGQIGEIAARGPLSPMQYVNAPELDARYRDAEGWVYTGDLGLLDSQGYLILAGRKKDIIIRGGTNISPSQIENLISAHPDVVSVACVPVPDSDLGHKAGVCLVLQTPDTALDLPALTQFLQQRGLERNKLPQYLRCYRQFPVTPAGKIDKRKLSADLEASMAQTAMSLA